MPEVERLADQRDSDQGPQRQQIPIHSGSRAGQYQQGRTAHRQQGSKARKAMAAVEHGEGRHPQKQARMYGMWMIDYYPYFHIARSHVRLENWQCAKNALEISQRLEEIPGNAPEISELLSLQRETERRLQASP